MRRLPQIMFGIALGLALFLSTATPVKAALVVDGTLFDLGPFTGTTFDLVPFTVVTVGTTSIDVLSWEFIDPVGPPVDVNGDGEFAFFDPAIHLFVDDGSLDLGDYIASSFDNFSLDGYADGSVSFVDPFLELALTPGAYLLAVGAEPDFSVAKAIAGTDPDFDKLYTIHPILGVPFPGHDHGDYRITFSDNVTTATMVPEPTSLVIMSSLALISGVTVLLRRRRSQAN